MVGVYGWLVAGYFIHASDPQVSLNRRGQPRAWLEARSNGLSPDPQRFG